MNIKSGIYGIRNKINDKWYIGQSQNIKERNYREKRNMKLGKFHNSNENPHFVNAIKKYGVNAFEFVIIEYCSVNELNEKEIYYIKKYNSKSPNGYNLTDGGKATRGYKHTKEARKKMSEIQKRLYAEGKTCFGGKRFIASGKDNPNYGKRWTCTKEEYEKKYGKRRSYVGENNPNYGKHPSEKTKEIWHKQRTGRKLSKEWRKKISENSASSKKVKCIETGKIYKSCVLAAKDNNIKTPRNIGDVCNGKHKTCGGLHWVFV